jgi:hypothetical protein
MALYFIFLIYLLSLVADDGIAGIVVDGLIFEKFSAEVHSYLIQRETPIIIVYAMSILSCR